MTADEAATLQGYTEVRYDEEKKRVVSEPLQLSQAFRNFEGATSVRSLAAYLFSPAPLSSVGLTPLFPSRPAVGGHWHGHRRPRTAVCAAAAEGRGEAGGGQGGCRDQEVSKRGSFPTSLVALPSRV